MNDIQLESTSFASGESIPPKHAYRNENLSPALEWSAGPEGTVTWALVCDDPDAPSGTWVHWVMYGLPATVTKLPEGIPTEPETPQGARQGRNDFGEIGYGGPWPPKGSPHRYFFRLYALDFDPDLEPGATKADLLRTMKGHILAEGELMGTFQR